MNYNPGAYPAQQHPEELRWFVDILVKRGARSFLEIGSRFGQTLWDVGTALPKGSVIVSVDKPVDDNGRQALSLAMEALRDRGQRTFFVEGDSRDNKTILAVRSIMAAENIEAFDALFIDADHKIESIVLDWINYGRLAKLVAFHDVGFVYDQRRLADYKPHKPVEKKRIDVPDFWRILKDRSPHLTSEKIVTPGKWGIGVMLWSA